MMVASPPRSLTDPQRPRYHYLPPANWLNDPNGLMQWRGRYHLFYQYSEDPTWQFRQWGHAASSDLVHWQDLPIALAPTPGGPDADGCFSGCAVGHNGVPTIIYTGVRGEAQLPCVATSTDDDLITWQKYPANPVIAAPPAGIETVIFRDHSVWNEGGTWYQAIGSGIRDAGGTALLYRSDDLMHWTYLHPLCVGDKQQTEPVWTGEAWECPSFFALDGEHVLMVSAWDGRQPHQPAALIGAYANHRLTPRWQGLVDGGCFYAPQVFIDDHGRRVMFGWLRERRTVAAQHAVGWSGVMSLPRILSLGPDGGLSMTPAPELTMLRRTHQELVDLDVAAVASPAFDDIRGDTLELLLEIEPGNATAVSLRVRCSPDGAEAAAIDYDWTSGELTVDTRRSCLDAAAAGELHAMQLDLQDGEPLRLHVFLDHSVIEVFANNRACLSERVYPTRADSQGTGLAAVAGQAHLRRLDAWQLAGVWPDAR